MDHGEDANDAMNCYILHLTKYYGTILCIFSFINGAGLEPSPLLLQPFIGLLYQPSKIDGDDSGATSRPNE
jgi:hypothetical protein